ncbi:MAG: YbjN domain-containing protein [Chloroflexi bacterium]|nr:YbjN domain-containing protein [Chloroflexota bacterium]
MTDRQGESRDAPVRRRPRPRLTWAGFERRLAAALGRMAGETFLTLTQAAGADAPGYYVQFAHHVRSRGGSAGLRAEAVGSPYLPPGRPLTPAQEAQLDEIGWERPGPDEPGRNLFRDFPLPASFEDVARLAVRTLRDVFAIGAPDELRYRHQSFERGPVAELDLGIEAEARTPTPRPRARPRPPLDELRAQVEAGLRGWLHLDELIRDEDGDYPVRLGSVLMFVRLLDGVPPVVRIFAPILRDIPGTPELLGALNDVNRTVRFGRAIWTERQVVVTMDLTAIDLTADQVAFACVELGNLADYLDDGLHGRFGGSVLFDSRPSPVN